MIEESDDAVRGERIMPAARATTVEAPSFCTLRARAAACATTGAEVRLAVIPVCASATYATSALTTTTTTTSSPLRAR